MDKYEIMGIHDKDVLTVEGNVARVRMFIGEQIIDEDFDLPTIPSVMPVTMAVYDYLLKPVIEKRMNEIKEGVN